MNNDIYRGFVEPSLVNVPSVSQSAFDQSLGPLTFKTDTLALDLGLDLSNITRNLTLSNH